MEILPTDALISIFKHLDGVSLITSAKVCNRWHDIITGISSLARIPTLYINSYNIEKVIENSKEYPFRSVYLQLRPSETLDHTSIHMYTTDGIREFYDTMRELFRTIDQRLETFNLYGFEGYVPNLLQMNPNMKNLYLTRVNYIRKHITYHELHQRLRLREVPQQFKETINPNIKAYLGINTDDPIQITVKEHWSDDKKSIIKTFPHIPVVTLNNLKFMKITEVQNILYWLEAPNLETLIIKNYYRCPGINEFLKTTENSLKNLTIVPFWIYFVENLDNLKLEKLEIGKPSDWLYDMNYENRYNNFFMTQISSLRELTIHFDTFETKSINIIDFINKNLNLTKLSVICKLANMESRSGTKTMTNEQQINGFKIFITKCNKVTILNLNFDFFVNFDIISHIAVFMPNLKSLTIHPFFSKVPPSSVLSGVDILKITKLREVKNRATWYEIALACPNIKELSLNDDNFEISPMSLKRVLESSSELRILNLTGYKKFEICENILKIFLGERINVLRTNVYATMEQDEFNKKIKILKDNLKIQTVYHKIPKKDYWSY